MRIFYTDHFDLPLPEGHRFPMSKYRLLRRHIAEAPEHSDDVLLVPEAATDEQLRTCHSSRYFDAVIAGTLTDAEVRRIGFPWSEKLVQRSRRSAGATLAAARAAVGGDRVSVNLAGGTHHAMQDAGEGYCVFNDAAVAVRSLQAEGLIQRACVIDLDVHQGNGTAEITAGDDSIVTLSVHGERNFPIRKFPSDFDIDLPDGTTDDEYIQAVDLALDQLSSRQPFDLAIYLAGADPFEGDRLGRLCLTKNGLQRRDEQVLRWVQNQEIPVAIAMAGGYAPNVDDIVQIHHQTVAAASNFYREVRMK